MSQIATPSPGIFYPPMWLFVLFSYSRALALGLLLHQLIAGAGPSCWYRLWGGDRLRLRLAD